MLSNAVFMWTVFLYNARTFERAILATPRLGVYYNLPGKELAKHWISLRGYLMKKTTLFIASLLLVTGVNAEDRSAEDIYEKACQVCHANGAAGAPKTGDDAAWAARKGARGLEGMLATVKTGKLGGDGNPTAMPPMAMCMDCSDEEFKAVIEYMSKLPQ